MTERYLCSNEDYVDLEILKEERNLKDETDYSHGILLTEEFALI